MYRTYKHQYTSITTVNQVYMDPHNHVCKDPHNQVHNKDPHNQVHKDPHNQVHIDPHLTEDTWKALLVPRWSMSWHRQEMNKANCSTPDSICSRRHF